MSGSLTALAAQGAQNAYLNISPEVTFWKSLYKRVTNFSVEPIPLEPSGGQAAPGKTVTFKISRQGDLVNQQYLVFKLPDISADSGLSEAQYIDGNVGHGLIDQVSISIGGQQLDMHTGQYLDLCHHLSAKPGHERSIELASADGAYMQYGTPRGHSRALLKSGAQVVVPLKFWYNTNASQSLPVIALQFHEITITVKFNPLSKVLVDEDGAAFDGSSSSAATAAFDCQLLTNYVYLDTSERRLFAVSPHESLITQCQYQGTTPVGTTPYNATTTSAFTLTFNHPVKEFVWCFNGDKTALDIGDVGFGVQAKDNTYTADAASGKNTPAIWGGEKKFDSAKFTLNGHDRFAARPEAYFNQTVPAECHTRQPSKKIYVWSSALEPESWRPSGSINTSRIDVVKLLLTGVNAVGKNLDMYASNFNTLKIVSGMAGLRFSN